MMGRISNPSVPEHIMTFLRLGLIALSALILAACVTTPIPPELRGRVNISDIRVTVATDAKGSLSRDTDEAALAEMVKNKLRQSLADMRGPVPVRAEVKIVFYSMPTGAAGLIPIATAGVPTMEGKVKLFRQDDGRQLGEELHVAGIFSTSAAILVGSGAVHNVDEQMDGVTSEFVKNTKTFLLRE